MITAGREVLEHHGSPNHNGSLGDRAMAKSKLPSPETMRQLLDYDPHTGAMTWKTRAEHWFRTKLSHVGWNKTWAGTPALNSPDAYGYLTGAILGQSHKAHRVIWALHYGRWPKAIDHINGVVTDNRISNLREISKAENALNSKLRSDSTSGQTGVSFDKARGFWKAYININGKQKFLGRHETKQSAIRARRAGEKLHDVQEFVRR